MPGGRRQGSTGLELVGQRRERAVAIRDAARRMRPPGDGHLVVADRDVGVVILDLGVVAETADERERVAERGELEGALELAVVLCPI